MGCDITYLSGCPFEQYFTHTIERAEFLKPVRLNYR